MNAIKQLMMLACMAAVIAGATGCSTTRKGSQWSVETVSFSDPISVPTVPKLKKRKDPEAYVKYCLALSELGRHESAGDFLMEAAQRFRSQRNEFAISAYSAAANEYFHAGNMEKFRNAVWLLHTTADRYQLASFDTATSALLALGDVVDGSSIPMEYTPRQLRELYTLSSK